MVTIVSVSAVIGVVWLAFTRCAEAHERMAAYLLAMAEAEKQRRKAFKARHAECLQHIREAV